MENEINDKGWGRLRLIMKGKASGAFTREKENGREKKSLRRVERDQKLSG